LQKKNLLVALSIISQINPKNLHMKKFTPSLLLFFFCYSASSYSQAPSIQWQQTYGGSGADEAQAIDTTSDRGYIVAGWTTSDNGEVTNYDFKYDAWVIKLDSNGNIQWESAYGGSNNDIAYDVHQTKDGGYIVAGFSESSDGDLSGAGGHGESDFWVFKLDAKGNLKWSKEYGGASDDDARSIQQTSDGGYIVAGETFSTEIPGEHGGDDFLIIKIDSVGNVQWQQPFGGSGNDFATGVIQISDGSYMVVGGEGSTDGQVTGNRGSDDYWVLHLNAQGTLLSQKTFGGTGLDDAYAIANAGNGRFYVAGASYSSNGQITGSHGNGDFWIIKIDGNENLIWQKDYGGSNYDQPTAVALTTDGGCLVTGMTNSNNGNITDNHGFYDVWAVKLDSNGKLKWQEALGGSESDEGYGGKQTRDGGFILAGFTGSMNGNVTSYHGGNSDFWVIKLKAVVPGAEALEEPDKLPIHGKNELLIYPNPNTGPATLNFSTDDPDVRLVCIRVLDGTGKTVFENTFPLQSGHLHTEIQWGQRLPSGIYFVTAIVGNKRYSVPITILQK
jgi:hypothetical protein